MIKKRFWIIVLTLALLLGTISFSVLAQTTWPPSTSDLEGVLEGVPNTPEIIGDDPDEVGYTGEIMVLDSVFESSADAAQGGNLAFEESSPSYILEGPDVEGWQGVWQNPLAAGEGTSGGEESEEEVKPDWNQLLIGEPDYIDPSAENSLDAGLDITYDYLFVAGVAMRPRTNNTDWQYYDECLIVPKGNEWFVTPISLPETATIVGLRMYYYDKSAATSYAWVTKYDGEGVYEDLVAPATSAGDTGYGTSYIALNQPVDNVNWSYVLNYKANQTGTTMRLCGLRVFYSMP